MYYICHMSIGPRNYYLHASPLLATVLNINIHGDNACMHGYIYRWTIIFMQYCMQMSNKGSIMISLGHLC